MQDILDRQILHIDLPISLTSEAQEKLEQLGGNAAPLTIFVKHKKQGTATWTETISEDAPVLLKNIGTNAIYDIVVVVKSNDTLIEEYDTRVDTSDPEKVGTGKSLEDLLLRLKSNIIEVVNALMHDEDNYRLIITKDFIADELLWVVSYNCGPKDLCKIHGHTLREAIANMIEYLHEHMPWELLKA